MLKNTINSYGAITKILHWVTAIIIISIISVGFYMTSMDNSKEKYEIYALHKSFGIIVLCIVLSRIAWRGMNIKVAAVPNLPKILTSLASIGHFLLYIFMLIMPISGMTMSLFSGRSISFFNLFSIPAFAVNKQLASFFHLIHNISAKLLVALIIGHILGALYHHFIRKDQVLKRML
ncbi:MAG: hypothetical protein DGJ47_000907 [Rickettsiaceae bacterium]